MPVPRLFLPALVAAVVILPLPAADSTMLDLVMPDAKVVAGFDAQRIQSSPFGQHVLRQMEIHDKELSEFITATGFDPRRDLSEILVATMSAQKHGDTIVIGRGFFDESKLSEFAAASGGTVSSYKGVKLLTGKGTNPGALAFLGGSLVVLGNEAAVREAIDRRQAGEKIAGGTAVRIQQVSGRYDAWLFTLASPAALAPQMAGPKAGGPVRSDLFQAVLEASGGVRFGANIEVSGEALTRSEKDASALADVVRLLAGMAVSNRPADDPALRVLESLELTTEGNVMRFSFTLTEADLEKLFKSGPHRGTRVRAVAHRPR